MRTSASWLRNYGNWLLICRRRSKRSWMLLPEMNRTSRPRRGHRYTSTMCGRFTLRTPMTVLIKHFAIDVSPDQLELEFNPRYNIPPSVDVPIIRLTDDK